MLAPGTEVDRYRVEHVLGTGGMASVYLVRHRLLGSAHALKLLTQRSPRLDERLWREGRAQAQLRHPNLVAVTDVIEVDGAPALVLEYVAGPTLDEQLVREALPPDQADAVFRGILAGVEAAHAAGLVHRDLKPSNVLLDRQGDRLVPKVSDFGLVKVVEDWGLDVAQGQTPLTRGAGAMGTPAYMAPEQVRDARDVDQRADIFALGCILYEMVCGQRAFTAADPFATQELVVRGRYPAPESVRPDLDPRLARVIRACLAVDRAERPQDCGALRALMDGAEPPGPVPWTAPRGTAAFTYAPTEVGAPSQGVTAVPAVADDGAAPGLAGEAPGDPAATVELDAPPRGEETEEEAGATGARRVAWGIGAAALVVLGIGVAGVLWGLGPGAGSGEGEPGGVAPAGGAAAEVMAADPAVTTGAATGAPSAGTATDPPATGPPAAAPTAAPTASAGVTPTTISPAPKTSLAPTAAPTAASERPSSSTEGGHLVLTSAPYAEIQVDGSPWRAGTTVSAGAHHVRWECRSERCAGQVHEETVRVAPGETATYCWSFDLDARCVGG